MIQVIWTRRVFEFFADAANLTPLERGIMETRISGMSRLQQSSYFSISLSSLDRAINRIKRKYDEVQKEFPDELKPRRSSTAETFLDQN